MSGIPSVFDKSPKAQWLGIGASPAKRLGADVDRSVDDRPALIAATTKRRDFIDRVSNNRVYIIIAATMKVWEE